MLEGVLTYVNAFLILDLARELFKGRPFVALIIIAIVTILIFARTRALRETHTHSLLFPLYEGVRGAADFARGLASARETRPART